MRFNVYGRFQVEIRREGSAWAAYRPGAGTRTPMTELVVPAHLAPGELATYLDDVYHEFAGLGDEIVALSD
jgi:hypothetical protein